MNGEYSILYFEELLDKYKRDSDEALRRIEVLSATIDLLKKIEAKGGGENDAQDEISVTTAITKSKLAIDNQEVNKTANPKRFSLARKEYVADKAVNIIKGEGRFLYRREILDLASKYNIKFIGDIKATLSYASKEEKSELILHKPQGNIGVYGLQSWLTIDGEIRPERIFIKNEDYERANREYKISFSWIEKVRFILRSKKELLTLNQILTNIIEDYEPTLNDQETIKMTKETLLGILKANLNKQVFRKRSIESMNEQQKYYYGLTAWQDDDGNLDSKYMPQDIEFE